MIRRDCEGFIHFCRMRQQFSFMLTGIKKINLKSSQIKGLTKFSVCEIINGATLRVKCEILENKDNASLSAIFLNNTQGADFPQAVPGLTLYVDITTGQQVNDVLLSADKCVIKQIVYIK